MLKRQVSQILNINLNQLKRLGIDEISLVKGQGNYLAVLVDLDIHKPVEIVQSLRIEDIREVLISWGFDVLNQTSLRDFVTLFAFIPRSQSPPNSRVEGGDFRDMLKA